MGFARFHPKQKGPKQHQITFVVGVCASEVFFFFNVRCFFADSLLASFWKNGGKSVKIRRLWDKNGNRSRSGIAFLICACFNILNEFLCVGWSNTHAQIQIRFSFEAVDNDNEDNDALLRRCCRSDLNFICATC